MSPLKQSHLTNQFIPRPQFLKKSLRIERVAEEVKLVLKPHYNKKHITKEEYKEILRKSVPKVRKPPISVVISTQSDVPFRSIRFATTKPARSTFKRSTRSSRLTSRRFATKGNRGTLPAHFKETFVAVRRNQLINLNELGRKLFSVLAAGVT